MTAGSYSPGNLMVQKLESIFPLTDEERQALHEVPVKVTALNADQDVVRVGERPSHSCLVLEGFTCVYKLTREGKRQIMALHVPGDMPDLQSLHLKVLDISIASISPCTVGFIQHKDLHRICKRYPRLTDAFWRETLADASVFREWLLNIGRREAYTRMAHLLCELLVRLRTVGLVDSNVFDLPLTQPEIADLLGTSTVHVNRVFKRLRDDGLIQTEGTRITVPDWDNLKEAGDFDPLYLHLEELGDA